MVRVLQVLLSGAAIAMLMTGACGAQPQQRVSSLHWSALPDLPDALGRAGVFAGVHQDALLIAGGANFAQPVWETGKTWHDDIYVLTRDALNPAEYQWHEGFKLPAPRAYGASVSTSDGLLCIGGSDDRRLYDEVFLLQWNPADQAIQIKPLPPLPSPCAYMSAAAIGSVIYVAGGTAQEPLETAMNNFWSLDMSKINQPAFQWEILPPWPGPSRAFNITAAQHNGSTDCIYVISGRRSGDSGEVELLTDVYEFSPASYSSAPSDQTGRDQGKISPWRKRSDIPQCRMGGSAVKIGQSHLFVLGGDDGTLYGQGDILKDRHPGFSKRAFAYHTITDVWTDAGPMPANQVTTTAVRWGTDPVTDPIIIPSGEIRPRVRSAKIWKIMPLSEEKYFGLIDFSVLGLYLALMIGVGVFFSFRNKNSNDFFRGGQRVPWFVAGLSIFATMLSSITFIAIPAKAFATDWVYFIVNLCVVIVAPFVIWFFLPFFRKIDATSAYEYLDKRFNRFVRLFASASFILFQIGRMAVVMYLPALALAVITPMTMIQCILLMGILSLIYCTMGGLEAVVWTDSIQSFILLGGALLSILLIIARVDGGMTQLVTEAVNQDKFHMINWDFSSGSFAAAALWVVFLGGIGQSLVPYSSDMAVVQRYMSVPDIRQARRAIWTNAIAVIPASLLFFGVGTALFVFYRHHPERLDPTFKTDAIFPMFIARELPVGIAGLVVAGIFAAAQSTISTSMNSVSSAFVTDFVRPLNLVKTEQDYLKLARWITLTVGLLGTAIAVLLATSDIKSVWDQFMKILGLFGGSLCGLFCLGIFTTRTNGKGAVIGAIAGAVGLFCVQQYTQTNLLLHATVGITICYLTGYLSSLLFAPPPSAAIKGLTIYTIKE